MRSLSVNLDHIATLREVRKVEYPSLPAAISICELAGADGVTLHLRGDRRHIQDKDVKMVKEITMLPFTLEMAPTEEMVKIALKIKPDKVTLVPERRMEITTEGGLELKTNNDEIKKIVSLLKEAQIKVCLFLEPDIRSIEIARKLEVNAVEIHTGKYAILFNQKKENEFLKELEKIKEAVSFGNTLGLQMNVGHGIHYQNVKPLAKIKEIQEFSIGHSIVSRALFVGLEKAIKEMIKLIHTR